MINKPEHQFGYFSSNGHVIWERISSLRLRGNYMLRLAILLIVVTAICLYIVVKTSAFTGNVAGWVAGKGQLLFSASAPKTDLAPAINLTLPVVPFRGQSEIQFAQFSDVVTEMKRLTGEFKGEAPAGCLTNNRLNNSWWSATEATPRCRLSNDKERLWVWAIVSDVNGNPSSFMSLIRRNGGKAELFNVQIGYNNLKINGAETLNPNLIPRTFAYDFPELGGSK